MSVSHKIYFQTTANKSFEKFLCHNKRMTKRWIDE